MRSVDLVSSSWRGVWSVKDMHNYIELIIMIIGEEIQRERESMCVCVGKRRVHQVIKKIFAIFLNEGIIIRQLKAN